MSFITIKTRWNFTKLGHIKDTTYLKEVLGKGSVQVTLLME